MEEMILQRCDPLLVQQFHNTAPVKSELEMRKLKARIKASWEEFNSEVKPDGRE